MCSTHRKVSMGFTDGLFEPGTHMCFIYSDEEERREIMSRFLDSGLDAGEQVSYFADVMPPEEVNEWLGSMGVAVTAAGERGQFGVWPALETYCPDGRFMPEDLFERLSRMCEQASSQGFPGVRMTGEMTWALKQVPGSERLVEYESRVNEVAAQHELTCICQYDARRFDGATILGVMQTHPFMVVRGQVVENPYYMAPAEFLSQLREST